MAEGTYGCAQAQTDIDTYFEREAVAKKKPERDLKANAPLLERAFAHMRDEKDPVKPTTKCYRCWRVYQVRARKNDADI